MKIYAGFARSVLKRGHDGIEIWLARAARHRSDGQIRDIRAGFTGSQDAGRTNSAGVVGVEVNGQANFLRECFDQLARGSRPADSSHVFDAEEMSAHSLQLAAQLHIIL